MVIIRRVGIYSKAMVMGYGEVDKDLGVGEGEDLLRKIDSFKKLFLVGGNCFTVLCWFLPYKNVNRP